MNIRTLFVVFSTLIICSCGLLVKSEVTVFHQIPDNQMPKTYAFVPLEDQIDDLEYKTYASLIAEQLKQYGYNEVSLDAADLFIVFDYSIGSGETSLVSVPTYGQTGYSSSTTYGILNTYGNYGTYSGTTYYTPTYGVTGSRTVSKTEYPRKLVLHIIEKPPVDSKEINTIYQAEVDSAGSSSQLSKVMPSMIKALFKEFPGESGKSRSEVTTIQ